VDVSMSQEESKHLLSRESSEKELGSCRCCGCFSSFWSGLTSPSDMISISSFQLSKAQKTRLENLRISVNTRFDPDNSNHRTALISFAKIAIGQDFTQNELKSPKWKSIGFQGNDPATDFRGAGLFGLENLNYFVIKRPDVFRRMVLINSNNDIQHFLPFAITGLNITFMLTSLLSIGQSFRFLLNRESAIYYSSFIALLEQNENAFEEIYTMAFVYLEGRWTRQHVKYIDFPLALQELKSRLESVLKIKPTSLAHLEAILTH